MSFNPICSLWRVASPLTFRTPNGVAPAHPADLRVLEVYAASGRVDIPLSLN